MKTTAALNVRSDASTSSRVVTTLGQGVTVTVTAKKNGTSVEGNKTWYYVSGKGWVSGAYLTTTSSSSNNSGSTTTNQKMKTTEILNVRSDASTSSSITGSLSKGQPSRLPQQNRDDRQWHEQMVLCFWQRLGQRCLLELLAVGLLIRIPAVVQRRRTR